jgi:hypothetical protein
MTFNFQRQIEQSKQQAAQIGFSGSAIVDVQPASGIIRLKISSSPPESLKPFITNYVNFLMMSLNAMNVDVKIHISEGS